MTALALCEVDDVALRKVQMGVLSHIFRGFVARWASCVPLPANEPGVYSKGTNGRKMCSDSRRLASTYPSRLPMAWASGPLARAGPSARTRPPIVRMPRRERPRYPLSKANVRVLLTRWFGTLGISHPCGPDSPAGLLRSDTRTRTEAPHTRDAKAPRTRPGWGPGVRGAIAARTYRPPFRNVTQSR